VSKVLLAFDTDRVKEYVFATGALRDIRGASALLDQLNRSQMPRLVQQVDPDARAIYANGGSGLFVVDHSHVEAAQRAVQQEYRQRTEIASVSAASVELPAAHEDIHRQWRQLAYRLRAAKDRNPPVEELTSHALLRPCEACGLRYSTSRWQGPEDEQRLCGGCQRKREEDSRVKSAISRWLDEPQLTSQPSDPLWRRLLASLRTAGYPLSPALSRPEEFDTLATASQPEGYLGLIYADGDGIGRELEQLGTLKEIGQFARAVDAAAYDALVQAIGQHLHPVATPEGPVFPFDVLLLGGDDLVLVTVADRTLEVALSLVEGFAEKTRKQLGRPLRLSAMVVLAHARYPFGALLKLAESGLLFAKQEAARQRQKQEGLLNFLVVSSPNHLDFASYVERTLRQRAPTSDHPLERTLRPYSAAGFRQLLASARRLKQAPRSRLQQLRKACFLDFQGGRLEARATLLRWRESAEREEVQALVRAYADAQQVDFPWFYERTRKLWRTPLIDVVEILDFVAAEEGDARAT
jgi:hypothetical protein